MISFKQRRLQIRIDAIGDIQLLDRAHQVKLVLCLWHASGCFIDITKRNDVFWQREAVDNIGIEFDGLVIFAARRVNTRQAGDGMDVTRIGGQGFVVLCLGIWLSGHC